jgi:hypothetical protein
MGGLKCKIQLIYLKAPPDWSIPIKTKQFKVLSFANEECRNKIGLDFKKFC